MLFESSIFPNRAEIDESLSSLFSLIYKAEVPLFSIKTTLPFIPFLIDHFLLLTLNSFLEISSRLFNDDFTLVPSSNYAIV